MSAQLLVADLNSLISDSKRKLPDLRQAAEKSLSDLKALPTTSDSQLAADLSRRPHFIEPFLAACRSKNSKFAATGVSSLQRLAVLSALPKTRLREVLDAIQDCSNLAQDVQLKILQILPTILQNYAEDVRGELLFSLLQTCSTLQSSKTTAVSSTAAATFQQVLSALFEELQREDLKLVETPISAEAPGLEGVAQLRPVAHDAVRVLQDLCLLAEGGKPTTIRLSPLPETSSLELVESILANYSEVVSAHTELAYVLKSVLLPYLINAFQEKRPFAVTVRISRLLYMVVRNHNHLFPEECGRILECFNHLLDQNEAQGSWKRVISLEIYRGIFTEPSLVLHLYSICDEQPNGKPIFRSCTASFVRLASEKPALIGLSQQSTIPIGNYFQRDSANDLSGDTSGTGADVEGTAGVSSSAVPGISNQWSSVRSPFIDQLDKTDPPTIPDTYPYSLVLLCLNNLSDSLAKFVLPLTVQHSGKSKKRSKQKPTDGEAGFAKSRISGETESHSVQRTPSLKKRNVPVNPLEVDSHYARKDIKSAAALIDQCWPAILATCSTFFYAALDSDHYRALVRSFQKFAQVAGLLRMSTPRDAFLTTLGKAAVPAHVVATLFTATTATSTQSPSLLRSATGLLNVENLVNQASTLLPDRGRRSSLDGMENALSSRNLLCLRALLNLAIALGPTLDGAWSIIFETLQQADKIISTINLRPMSRDARSNLQGQAQSQVDVSSVQSQVISSEIAAIQAAVSRLFDSTADFPNENFMHLLKALCIFVDPQQDPSSDTRSPPPTPSGGHRRVSSFAGVSTRLDTVEKDFVFALSKIRELVTANIDRFINYPPAESGLQLFVSTIRTVATHSENPSTARLLAAELLSRLTRDIISVVNDEELEHRDEIRLRALSALSNVCVELDGLAETSGTRDDTSNEVHSIVLETLRAIVEQIGENLISGWDIVFEIICTAFTQSTQAEVSGSNISVQNTPEMKTIALGRSAFGSVQLICSDFLSSVPDSSLLTLIDTIHRFAAQHLDLNMSLTAATLFWNISDLLYNRLDVKSLDEFARVAGSTNSSAISRASTSTLPSLWIHLLSRISLAAGDSREEVRTGAISTLIRIFDNHGDDLSANAWQLVLQSILLQVVENDARSFTKFSRSEVAEVNGRVATSKLVLEGVAKLVSTYIDAIATCPNFLAIWTSITSSLSCYLLHGHFAVDQAVFDAITTVLAAVNMSEKIGGQGIQQVTCIWAGYSPTDDAPGDSNQDAFQSYVRSLRHIYRLSAQTVTAEVITGIVGKLRHIIQTSGSSLYTSDKDSMTKLQKEVLDVVRLLRTDLDGAPSCIISLYTSFIALPFSDYASGKGRPTFIALAKASMDHASVFASENIERKELFRRELLNLLIALETPIRLKYSWDLQGKKPVLWQKATSTALSILEIVIPRLGTAGVGEEQFQKYWDVAIAIGKGIVSARLEEVSENALIFEDEEFDVDALQRLTKIIIPALGSNQIPDSKRRMFARALFSSSIIHPPEFDEFLDLESEPLKDLYHVRFGRTYNPEATQRQTMAYRCLGDLISLVSAKDSSPEHIKLAQAAAPYLILRTAIPLRLYIADHPLRGRYMPLPSSQRQELLFILKKVRELDSEPKAIPETESLKTQSKRHLVRIYPLVVKAIEVEGRRAKPDEELLEELRAVLEAVGQEFML
ncbi:uncharacterized protein PV09_02432 [Verruconis gallopava]|uniref:Endosomal peripheral membrane protein n=1 Tax=Verruconis gallopava TaxID=253628 RepID=A0A0D2B669_9PEZI|nr:uncharacterized protein PV09_02432 [Verruconis gallopava]KIW06739.1 hypothetical protein PV09_02432 [Verruconis gallopava]